MPHLDDCTCLDCVDHLRHDHDRAQAQALGLLDRIDRTCDELRKLRSDIDRRIDRTLRQLDPLVGRTRKH